MKDYPYVPGWRQNKENNKPAIKNSVLMLTTHGIAEGEWVGNEWVQYRWSCKVKDTEVLYWMHLEDLTQLEKEGDCFQSEPPEVDLEKEIDGWYNTMGIPVGVDALKETASHFAEWGAIHLNPRKGETK